MFHHEEGHSSLVADIEDTDDILVTETRGYPRFEPEQLVDLFARHTSPMVRDELECDRAIERAVVRHVDDAHRPSAKALDYLEAPAVGATDEIARP